MRVNMDSSIVFDPRFRLAAKKLGVSLREVIGACFLLWVHCYQSRSDRLTVAEANASADLDGFAEALISVGLADELPEGRLTIHGVKKRIRFLMSQREIGKKGGKASAKARKSKGVTETNETKPNAQPTVNRTLPQISTDGQAYSPALAPTLSPTPAPPLTRTLPVGSEAAAAAWGEFWKAYPNKSREKFARQEFDNLPLTPELVSQIMAGLDRWKASIEWKKENGRFIPQPANWLREHRFAEHPTAQQTKEPELESAESILERNRRLYG